MDYTRTINLIGMLQQITTVVLVDSQIIHKHTPDWINLNGCVYTQRWAAYPPHLPENGTDNNVQFGTNLVRSSRNSTRIYLHRLCRGFGQRCPISL